MLRFALNRIVVTRWPSVSLVTLPSLTLKRTKHSGRRESLRDFNKRYVDLFLRWDIDGWQIRQMMNDLIGMDLVPDPLIIEAGLRACRQVNDIALAIRWIEACKDKCGNRTDDLYPYLMDHLKPIMEELGIPTLEELHYDVPQLALESVYDM